MKQEELKKLVDAILLTTAFKGVNKTEQINCCVYVPENLVQVINAVAEETDYPKEDLLTLVLTKLCADGFCGFIATFRAKNSEEELNGNETFN